MVMMIQERGAKPKLKDGDEAGYDCVYEMIQERGAKPIGRKGSPIEHVGSRRDRSRIRSSSGHPVHAQIYQVSVVVVVVFVVVIFAVVFVVLWRKFVSSNRNESSRYLKVLGFVVIIDYYQ